MAKNTINSFGKLRGAKEATSVVTAEGGARIQVLDKYLNADMRKLAAPGQDITAFEKALAVHQKAVDAHTAPSQAGAKLATGLTGRNAPHSSKAVGDGARAANKGAAKAPTAKAAAAPKAKAAPKADKAPASRTADHGQKLTVLVKAKDSGLRPDSGRYVKLQAAEKAKTVGDWLGKEVADATGNMHKCDRGALGGMIKRGHVKIG